MEIKEEKLALWLASASLLVLLINYSWLEIENFSLGLGILQFSGIKVREILPVVAAFALIVSMLIYHLINLIKSLTYMYRHGYMLSPVYEEFFKQALATAIGTDKHGAPRGGLPYTLLPGTFDIGQWERADGTQSARVVISIPWRVHISGMTHGFSKCHTTRVLLAWYGPAILAIWAVFSIAT